jgi:hypothetical protein
MEKNSLYINKKKWNTFSEQEMETYQEDLFCYFRKNGFPYYPTNLSWRKKEYEQLHKYDFKRCIDLKTKTIKQSMHGLALAWSYHPYHYEIQCNDMMTPMQVFQNDELLKKVIAKRIKYGDNMSDNGFRKAIKIFTGTQCVSNFRPTAAAAIYEVFAGSKANVFDMSHGFGGRCLGADLAGVSYFGIDPSKRAHEGCLQMIQDFGLNASIEMQGSEIANKLKDQSVDLCFTSPPYFNCEKYDNSPTQSFVKYPSKSEWVNIFMRDTLKECVRVVKTCGAIALNIQNVKSYPTLTSDLIKMAEGLGLYLHDTWYLQLSNINKNGFKTEPIFIFKIQ